MALNYCFFISLIFLLATRGCWGCAPTDIKVISGPSGRKVAGKPEWTVYIFNSCPCPVGGIVLSCPDFQTVEPIDPSMLLSSADGRCLINQGGTFLPKTFMRFAYAWDTKFDLPIKEINPQC